MSVRVVARIRPLLKTEHEKDVIVQVHNDSDAESTRIKIPNPKNFSEDFSFQFNSVYPRDSTQQQIYEAEVAPTVKHLFAGFDVTIFAYGSTGTGKTHTMRGGKSLADRGMIPRLLSSIYRKSRTMEKNSDGETQVDVVMSYYEIYNDRVYDLFESPEKRTATGLPIREAEGGKAVVVGLSEVPCGTLKEFEVLYDKANANRSTGATKLNAHSSRSHAILCVKLTITTPTDKRISTASAIDLAGSEDNRRTGNGKERMVESASINKSLFVLAQCVEAISKKQQRIPYRESKMTRILSLGQNNGFTVMILNLAPVISYHLDTLGSLNFANRTKKIEVREVENEPIFKGPPRQVAGVTSIGGANIQRQPLRPLANATNINLASQKQNNANDKPLKAFSVYSDKNTSSRPSAITQKSPPKRPADSSFLSSARPNKIVRPTPSFLRREPESAVMTKQTIENLVEKKVSEILATRTLEAPPPPASTTQVSDEVQRRLDQIEQRLAGQEGERAEGLSYLFMAKQHQARGEDGSALKMYELAQPYFPDNEKLGRKIEGLKEKIQRKREEALRMVKPPGDDIYCRPDFNAPMRTHSQRRGHHDDNGDASYHEHDKDESEYDGDDNGSGDDSFHAPPRPRKGTSKPKSKPRGRVHWAASPDPLLAHENSEPPTPRTSQLLSIINSRDVSQIKALNGVGVKKAEGIVEALLEISTAGGHEGQATVNWRQLAALRGIGKKTLESMRAGIVV